METATTEEKFHHAVELIKSLPKSGTFQPSNDLKLKFYSYFKQATEGPCDLPRPGFWDVVSRAKWDAWSRLGEMAKEEAMEHYVDEFVEILKTAPFDEKAHDYVHIMGPFIDLAPKEFRDKYVKVNGNTRRDSDALLHPPGEVLSNSCMPAKPIKKNNDVSDETSEGQVNGHEMNGATESDCEEFSDTFDQVNAELSEDDCVDRSVPNAVKCSNITQVRGGGEQRVGQSSDAHSPILGSSGNRGNRNPRRGRDPDIPFHQYPTNNPGGSGSGGRKNNENNVLETSSDISEQLAFAVIRLQHTMEQVVNRLDSLETLLQEKKNNFLKVSVVKKSFWSIFGIPLRTALLILGWPFLAHWLIYIIQKKRRR